MSSVISDSTVISASVMTQLLAEHREVLLAELAKMVASGKMSLPASVPAPSTGKASPSEPIKAKKEKKVKDPNAPKRPANSWIIFSAHVSQVVSDFETASELPKDERMKTVVAKQFASHLKGMKGYDDWSDDDILAELSSWTPPEISKQVLNGTSKMAKKAAAAIAASVAASVAGSVTSEAAPSEEPVADSVTAPSKKRGPMSDEAKAAMAAKKAANKAAKETAPPEDATGTAPVAAPKAITIKPKTVSAPAPVAKKVDLSFFPWTHDGTDYFTNDRGDVVSTEFEWVGHFDGSKIDESIPEPEDLASATMRE